MVDLSDDAIMYWSGASCMVACAQPSSRLYQRLDKLLLLSEGHTMYYGEPL